MMREFNFIAMGEGSDIGRPVWRFATARDETVIAYASSSLALTDEGSFHLDMTGVSPEWRLIHSSAVNTFSGRQDKVDFLWEDLLAEYIPGREKDLNGICKATLRYGGSTEVISPSTLSHEQLQDIAQVWTRTSRRLLYLAESNICQSLNVPWLYLLGLYNFAPTLTVFASSSKETLARFRDFTKDLTEFREISIEEWIAGDQQDYKRIYQSIEAAEPGRYWQPKSSRNR